MKKDSFLVKNKCIDDPVIIGGFTPLTTIDFPGELAAVLFLQGCSWRCGYCQNTDLIPRKSEHTIAWNSVIDFLGRRKGLLDAVVFSGGEPTLQKGLPAAIQQVKSMGFKIGLHTAGIYPKRLKSVIPMLDWVGMDVKSASVDYDRITGVHSSAEKALQSVDYLLQSNVKVEFRTTVHPGLLNEKQIISLKQELQALGIDQHIIQKCRTINCLDDSLEQ